MLTTQEVAERLGTSPSTVRCWRHSGSGPADIRVLYDQAKCER
ncbi:helix-turn-helix domain-containing protein [Modestobacter marinus]|nr:helix-turn-helix domain-containing protein [Modestobacter marinus]